MEVAPLPLQQPVEFRSNMSACSSSYITAPPSPRRSAGRISGAPGSPGLTSALACQASSGGAVARVSSPLDTKSKIGTHDSADGREEEEEEFEFDFGRVVDRAHAISAADELFDGGKIKTIGLNFACPDLGGPERNFQHFPEKTRKEGENRAEQKQSNRGRPERIPDLSSCSSMNPAPKGCISLSPFQVSDSSYDRKENSRTHLHDRNPPLPSPSSSANSSFSVSSSTPTAVVAAVAKASRTWRLRDLLLFRSASMGRASTSSKDPLRKYYSPLLRSKKSKGEDKEEEDLKATSFSLTKRATSIGSVSGSNRGSGSAHELHYKVNRAVSEGMRRKTFLPYKQDLLGCLGFKSFPGGHEFSREFRSLTR